MPQDFLTQQKSMGSNNTGSRSVPEVEGYPSHTGNLFHICDHNQCELHGSAYDAGIGSAFRAERISNKSWDSFFTRLFRFYQFCFHGFPPFHIFLSIYRAITTLSLI